MTKYGLKLRRRLIKKMTEPKVTEFTVYADLVVQEGKSRLEEIGVDDVKVYKTMPKKCKHCESEKLVCMDVLGSGVEPLFWMCDSCEALYLTKDKEETEILLEICSQYLTNPSDWGIKDGELD